MEMGGMGMGGMGMGGMGGMGMMNPMMMVCLLVLASSFPFHPYRYPSRLYPNCPRLCRHPCPYLWDKSRGVGAEVPR